MLARRRRGMLPPPAAPLALVDRADPRTRPAGAARADVALRAGRRPRRLLRRRHGSAPREPRAGRRHPHRRRHAGAPARPSRARATSTRRRCGRWCSTRPTRCSTSASARTSNSSCSADAAGAPHAAVLGHAAEGHRRRWPNATSATPCGSRSRASARGHADIDYRAVRIMPREIEHAVRQPAALRRCPDRVVFCNTRERGAPSPGEPDRARLLGRGAVGRTRPGRAQRRAPGPARRPRAGLRRHRRGRARHRPADLEPRHPRRPAARRRSAAAPQRPHRPGRAQGHLACCWSRIPPPPRRADVRQRRRQRRMVAARRRPTRSARSTASACSPTRSSTEEPAEEDVALGRGAARRASARSSWPRPWPGSTAPACRRPRR